MLMDLKQNPVIGSALGYSNADQWRQNLNNAFTAIILSCLACNISMSLD